MFFISDKKILFGIGIGLILGVILMFGYKSSLNLSDSKIEERARALGMHYSDECKAMIKGDENK